MIESMSQVSRNVLFVADQIAPGGGPAGYLYNLRSGLRTVQAAGMTFSYWGREAGKRSRFSRQATGPLQKITSKARGLQKRLERTVPGANRSLERAIKEADAVVFHGYQAPSRVASARRKGKQVIYMPHSPSIKADEEAMVAELMGRVLDTAGFRKAEQQIIDEADLVVFPTRDAAAEYFAAFDGDGRLTSKSRYIESGVPASNFEPRPRRDGSIGVIFVGRFVPHKGYDLFVDAAETLARRDFAAEFRTLGTGLQARDSAHVKNLGWSETPSEHLLDADVVVVPNRVAYFDLLPLEAAALGRGLVMTTVGGNRDQLKALPDSVGCAPQDLAEGIAQAVHLARTDITWGTANRRVFLERFTDSAMAARWVKLLEDCANVAS